ncbi:MAG TPA: DivIVA domain-containing protein [Candidatus Hydrogenedentes bacterium]|nr:DivIVA domain-containing protein [Candidatus Hydrogenedentota bacterium]
MRHDKMVSEVLGQDVALSPSDLMSAEIRGTLFGGYDKAEVEMLLERAANALEQALSENRRLRQQTEDQREQLVQFKEMEATLRSALISSQKYSETLVNSAKAQADALIEEARLIKTRAQSQMAELPGMLREEIQQLKNLRDRTRQDLEAVLRTHEALLKRVTPAEARLETAIQEETRSHFVDLGADQDAAHGKPAAPPFQAVPGEGAKSAIDFDAEDEQS